MTHKTCYENYRSTQLETPGCGKLSTKISSEIRYFSHVTAHAFSGILLTTSSGLLYVSSALLHQCPARESSANSLTVTVYYK